MVFFLQSDVLNGPSAHAQNDERPPIVDLIVDLQAKYDSVRDFSADFEHTYAGGVLRTVLVERGTVQIKKPGMMRWNYNWPEEKVFVSDGSSLYSYIPFDRQVIIGKLPSDDRASTPALFLAGRGNLSTDFTAAYDELETAAPDNWIIRLTPTGENVEYSHLVLGIDRKSLSITQLRETNYQGAVSTFTFTALKENEELPDSLFTFEIPRGTEIVTENSFRR